jgi:cell division protein FtsI/penicillin-binding protein 2
MTDTLRPENASPRAGAHRAPKTSSPVRASRASKARDNSRAGVFGVGTRSRSMLARTSAVVVLGAVVGVGLMKPGVPSPEPTVSRFLLDWESKNYLGAAELTTGQPQQVAGALADAYVHLDASDLSLAMRGISQHGKQATADFEASIDLGGSGLTWTYAGDFGVKDGRSGWRIVWAPSVIVPRMTQNDQLAVVSYQPDRAELLDSSGAPLSVKSPAYQVGVVPAQVTDPARTAALLQAVTQIPQNQIEGQIQSAVPGRLLVLLTLSPDDYKALGAKLAAIPGVRVQPERVRLFDSIAPDVVGQVGTEIASVLRTDGVEYRPGTTVGLSGLEQTFQRQLIGTAKTEVILQGPGGQIPLRTWEGGSGVPVRTTLNAGVQRAADKALAGLPASAAIVAVQPSSGQILAVASHQAGGMPGLDPLGGSYEPGQSFTMISAAAILSKGMKLNAPVSCYQRVGTFDNVPPVQFLGSKATFQNDFSHQCSTAFAGLAQFLTPSALKQAGSSFGIGGWSLPLPASSYSAGQLGLSGSASLGADMMGSGDVRVSPAGMALAAAVVDSGSWHAPSLVTGEADPASAPRQPESPQVLSELRELMQQAAQRGRNKVADSDNNVFAQSGTAPFGTGKLQINWFVGYQGNIAFAVVELGKSAAGSAAPLTGSFLRNVQAGS